MKLQQQMVAVWDDLEISQQRSSILSQTFAHAGWGRINHKQKISDLDVAGLQHVEQIKPAALDWPLPAQPFASRI